jgi:hypothetical protein
MDEALTFLESQREGEQISLRRVAAQFNVAESSLRRRYKTKCASRAEDSLHRQNLSPQQEEELVSYIIDLTSQALPPTRSMI